MRTLLIFIPVFLRVVVALSTRPSNIASPLSVKDQVLEQRCAIRNVVRHNKALTKSAKDEILERICQKYEDELRRRSPVTNDLVQAAHNYEQILEIPASMAIDCALSVDFDWNRWLSEEWVFINRGNDLFLRGMGRFNIPQVYDKLVAYRRREWKLRVVRQCLRSHERQALCDSLGITEMPHGTDAALAEQSSAFIVQAALNAIPSLTNSTLSYLLQVEPSFDSLPYWLVRVSLLQTWGYFGNALEEMPHEEVENAEWHLKQLLALSEDSPQRQHLIRYYHSWCEQENLASLDEIFRATKQEAFWPEGWELMKPSVLLKSLREHEREMELARQGGDVTYSHLSDLDDSGSLRVLRTSREIMNVGLVLKNCALSYADDVGREHCILIAKYDDVKKNKPIALGMIDQYYGDGLAETWSQIYLSCNRAAPEEVKQEFYDYEAVLRAWFRKKYLGAKDDNQ